MRLARLLLLLPLLTGCGKKANKQQAKTPTTHWNDVATQDVKVHVERVMHAFAAMQLDSIKAGLAPNVTAFETDLDGKPVRLGSRDEVAKFAEDLFGAINTMGARIALDIRSTDCHATVALGYCTVQFDFKMTTKDGKTVTQPQYNTIVLDRTENGWEWAHWQSSAAPPAPSAPSS
jgi:ketosteroid isomerase-like protein